MTGTAGPRHHSAASTPDSAALTGTASGEPAPSPSCASAESRSGSSRGTAPHPETHSSAVPSPGVPPDQPRAGSEVSEASEASDAPMTEPGESPTSQNTRQGRCCGATTTAQDLFIEDEGQWPTRKLSPCRSAEPEAMDVPPQLTCHTGAPRSSPGTRTQSWTRPASERRSSPLTSRHLQGLTLGTLIQQERN
ncbi:hypothetical protein P7K49_032546 [Saguinus oedipus]|uniref:Uncharacterized protein n=1 Tax=Saguinus oedipus TaxID=9490 RepID=A0ABQ9TZC3_SAGOE|nr:hypothetical protein P7K49_032546 [Saguinus oedipus]